MCVSVRERGRKNVCEEGGGVFVCRRKGEREGGCKRYRGREGDRMCVRDIEEEREIECV